MKKGQIGLMELIIVSIIIVLIITISMFYYFKFYKGRIERVEEELTEQKADVLLAGLISMPEFRCTTRGVFQNCVDVAKLESFAGLMADDRLFSNYYIGMFGWKKIRVERLYPMADGEWLLYNNPRQTEDVMIVSTPVSLYNPSTRKRAIGRFVVEVYQ